VSEAIKYIGFRWDAIGVAGSNTAEKRFNTEDIECPELAEKGKRGEAGQQAR
jgi:hypothetical protein